MSFVYPGFLFAIFAISIPIIIHLFHFRRFRKVFFSNVSFLQQLSDESKKQSRLRHLLVLAARVLAISFLVLAFARPFIPVEDTLVSMEGNAVSIYVDNSFSMDALARQGRLFDDAREKAREIAGAYQSTDLFQLLTNDFEGRHQRFVTREEFLAMVDEIDVSPAVRNVSEVLSRQSGLLQEAQRDSRRAYLISDFQKSSTLLEEVAVDTSMVITFLPLLAQAPENMYIDSCWFASPVQLFGQTARLTVRVVNGSEQPVSTQPVRLFIDDVQRTIATYDVAAGATTEVELSWTVGSTGIQQGRVEIVDYPVTFDDRLFFSYRVNEEIPVLSVYDGRPSPFLNALFGSDSIFRYEQMPAFSIDYSRFTDFGLIILDGLNAISTGLSFELQNFVDQGGHLLVFPGTSADLLSYQAFLGALGADVYTGMDTIPVRVSMIDERHRLYAGVFEDLPENLDLPLANKHYLLSRRLTSNSQLLMQMQSGAPFLSVQAAGKGQLFLAAVPLSDAFSNFQRHALFVPTMVNIALQSQVVQPLYHTLGHNRPVAVKGLSGGPEDVLYLRGRDMEIIPEQRRSGNQWNLFFYDQVTEAGNYLLFADDEPIKGLSYNYDRRESALASYDIDALSGALQDNGLGHVNLLDTTGIDFDVALQELRMGRQLWRHFLVLALFFLLVEVALLRWWRSF